MSTASVDIPELTFRSGLPGFPASKRFGLVRWGAVEGPYSVLVDLERTEVRFLVTPPGIFFPEYEVDIDDVTVAALDLKDPDEVLILVIVSLGERAVDATANLLGPIIVNTRTREGLQAVLPDSPHGTRVPLAAA